MKLRHQLGLGALVIAVLLCAGLGRGLFQALQPEEPRAHLKERARPQARPERPPVDTYTVRGRVLTVSGEPVAGIELVARAQSSREELATTRSDERGEYSLTLDQRAWLSIPGRPRTPHAYDLPSPPEDGEELPPQDNQHLDFTVSELCPFQVSVQDPAGAPLPGTRLSVWANTPQLSGWFSRELTLDETATAELPELPCGEVTLTADVPGWGSVVEHLNSEEEQSRVLVVPRGIPVIGRVTNTRGEPLQAFVSSDELGTETDDEGRYQLLLPPNRKHRVAAHPKVGGYVSSTESVMLASDQESLTLDFVLQRYRNVDVYCAGLPEDSCGSVVPMTCAPTWAPWGEKCWGSEPRSCRCPEGEVAIRGGGKAVAVHPGETEVWLDFEDQSGAIEARALSFGEPAECSWNLARFPDGFEDLAGGVLNAREGYCDDQGRVHIPALKSGLYTLTLFVGGNRHPQPDLRIQGEVVDLGDLELGVGGVIEGTVLDPKTGGVAVGEVVLANDEASDNLIPVGASGFSDSEGRFRITGLQDGDYSVFLARRPTHQVPVTVRDGEADHTPTLRTGEANLLTEAGFEVASQDDGGLVVSKVSVGGAADKGGLQVGDELVGVVVLGLDVLELAPGMAQEVTQVVLDQVSGGGVDLVVERGGELIEVSLD